MHIPANAVNQLVARAEATGGQKPSIASQCTDTYNYFPVVCYIGMCSHGLLKSADNPVLGILLLCNVVVIVRLKGLQRSRTRIAQERMRGKVSAELDKRCPGMPGWLRWVIGRQVSKQVGARTY